MLIKGEVIDDSCFITEKKFNEIKIKFGAPVRGDILITAVGTLANVYVVNSDQPFYFKDGNLIWLRYIKDVEAPFLGIQLAWLRSAILDVAIGSSQKALTIEALNSLSVAIPSLKEQRAISIILDGVDVLLNSLDSLIAKKRNLKQAAMQQLLTGQTRLPGFSGEWEVKQLGDVICEISDGGTPSTSDSRNFGGDVAWVVIDDIKQKIFTTRTTLTEKGLQACASRRWPKGTLIVSTGATIGEVGILQVSAATKQGICGIIFDPLFATTDFMQYWFFNYKKLLLSKAQGSSIKEVRAPTLVTLPLSLPAIDEQSAIATVLSDMDTDLTALESRRNKASALKQGMMQELLTGRTRLV